MKNERNVWFPHNCSCCTNCIRKFIILLPTPWPVPVPEYGTRTLKGTWVFGFQCLLNTRGTYARQDMPRLRYENSIKLELLQLWLLNIRVFQRINQWIYSTKRNITKIQQYSKPWPRTKSIDTVHRKTLLKIAQSGHMILVRHRWSLLLMSSWPFRQ